MSYLILHQRIGAWIMGGSGPSALGSVSSQVDDGQSVIGLAVEEETFNCNWCHCE